jgi:SsrA-binding protein
MSQTQEKLIASNRKAFHEYEIMEKFEAGIVLKGTEVKSLRMGSANFKDSYARIKGRELWLFNLHISPYDHGNVWNHEPMRMRKLLMHRREVIRLTTKTEERGLTLVPLRLYFKSGKAKVELGLARGKHTHDKRKDIAKKDAERDTQRELSRKYRMKL